MTNTALSVSGLTKRYGKRTVVDGLNIELPRGVVAGFVGPNGAGKTTTMAMLLGLVKRSGGSGTVLGRSIDHPAGYLPRVGALIETPAFYPALTATENLKLFAIVGGHNRADIDALLEVVGLAGRGDDRYRSFSLGMKQRLGIAAALLGDPELLILDEPSNGLDPQGMREMRELIAGLAESGRTVLVSSHDLSELEQVCNWLILIDTGRSLYQGPTTELLESTTDKIVVVPEQPDDLPALGDVLAGHGIRGERSESSIVVRADDVGVAALAAQVNKAAFSEGIVLVELTPLRTTLEALYLSMVEGGHK